MDSWITLSVSNGCGGFWFPPPLDQRQCCRWAYTGEILRLRSGQASWPPDFSLTCELTKRTSLRSFAPTPEAFRPAVFRPAFLSATDLLPARILPSAIRPKHSRNFLSAKSALPPCHRAPGCIPVAASWRNRMPRAARHVALIRALCARVRASAVQALLENWARQPEAGTAVVV